MLAAKANFQTLRQSIKEQDIEISKCFPALNENGLIFKARMLLYLLSGYPVYKSRDFIKIINTLLSSIDIDGNRKLGYYVKNTNLKIVYSDLYECKSKVADLDEPVLSALHKSCSIPIIFSSHNDDHDGQYVDGGLFDNLPTDVLFEANNSATIFAIGFRSERLSRAKSSMEYIYKMLSASIQQRVTQSLRNLGKDLILEIDSRMGELDFTKIVTVGLNREYDYVKEQTTNYFLAWNDVYYSDVLNKVVQKDTNSDLLLRHIGVSVIDYVSSHITEISCKTLNSKMTVNAYSLQNQNKADEIIIDSTIQIPSGKVLPGLFLSTLEGDGYSAGSKIEVYLLNPEDLSTYEKMQDTRYSVIYLDSSKIFPDRNQNRPYALLLFKGDLSFIQGRALRIMKRELRYGFMAPLKRDGRDVLVSRVFWPTNEISVQLNVPTNFSPLKVNWNLAQVSDEKPFIQSGVEISSVPSGYTAYIANVSNVKTGNALRGVFTVSGKSLSN